MVIMDDGGAVVVVLVRKKPAGRDEDGQGSQYKESGPAERAEKSAEKKNARDYPLPKKIKEFALLTQREGATG